MTNVVSLTEYKAQRECQRALAFEKGLFERMWAAYQVGQCDIGSLMNQHATIVAAQAYLERNVQ